MAGVSGRRVRVVIREIAKGRVFCVEGSRQGVIPVVLLGDMVRVMA